jgi:phage repressor protein C with HTH and peptisase S24 domain/transcriptional regulator with XRE-family HTH domain
LTVNLTYLNIIIETFERFAFTGNMKTFGQYVKERMSLLGKSQKDLAKRLGVSPAYISQLLNDKKKPPDLGRVRNSAQLDVWADFLDVSEEDLLNIVRFWLHGAPPGPTPRYPAMRAVLLERLEGGEVTRREIQAMELHPAEHAAIQELVPAYLALREGPQTSRRAYSGVRFKELATRLRANREFIEQELASFCRENPFAWSYDADTNAVSVRSDDAPIESALRTASKMMGRAGAPPEAYKGVPVVGHVSAGCGFEFTDGGYPPGEGFEFAELPPGVNPELAERLYCVRVRGESLREFINEGALLFIKPESWEEIRDGDLVIFKDRRENKAFVKKVEFSGESLILRSMNPMYKNLVLHKSELTLLERVLAVVFQ